MTDSNVQLESMADELIEKSKNYLVKDFSKTVISLANYFTSKYSGVNDCQHASGVIGTAGQLLCHGYGSLKLKELESDEPDVFDDIKWLAKKVLESHQLQGKKEKVPYATLEQFILTIKLIN